MAMSLRVSPEDENLIKEYAKMKNISVSELIRQTVIEQIEDEIDLRAAELAYEEYLANPVTHSFDEVIKDLGL